MKLKARHRRLDAFYRSKVLNSLLTVFMIGLMLCEYDEGVCPVMLLVTVLALVLFVGYSLWFWIKKPSRVVVKDFISEVSSPMACYVLIVMAISAENFVWYLLPPIAGVVMMFVSMLRNSDVTVTL